MFVFVENEEELIDMVEELIVTPVVAPNELPESTAGVAAVTNEEVEMVDATGFEGPPLEANGVADDVTCIVLAEVTFLCSGFDTVELTFITGDAKIAFSDVATNVSPAELVSIDFVLPLDSLESNEDSLLGKSKATCFVDLIPGLGTMADVEIGVVFAFVVVVEELRVAQVEGHGIDLTVFTSSA